MAEFNSRYWYKNADGETKRIFHCKKCLTPYKEEEFEKFYRVDKQEIYCNPCAITLKLVRPSEVFSPFKPAEDPFIASDAKIIDPLLFDEFD